MKIQINIQNRHVLIILLFIITASAIGLAAAYGGTSPSTMGHSWGEMDCSGCITSANIADGAITNADISPTAAIAGSKITGTVPAATSAGNADTVDSYHASGIVSWGSACNPVWGACSATTLCMQGTETCSYMGIQLTIRGATVCLQTASSQGGCGSRTCYAPCYPSYCPFFYSWNGQEYVKDTTIIYKLDSPEKEAVQLRELKNLDTGSTIRAKIIEEEKETSYIDRIQLEIVDTSGGEEARYELSPVYASSGLDRISASDNSYLVMTQGDEIYLEFGKAPALEDGWTRTVYIKAEGYYIHQ